MTERKIRIKFVPEISSTKNLSEDNIIFSPIRHEVFDMPEDEDAPVYSYEQLFVIGIQEFGVI